jgi:hypothetical protein
LRAMIRARRPADLAQGNAAQVDRSQVLPRQGEQNSGDEAKQDDNGHQQTPDSLELLVVHCFGG